MCRVERIVDAARIQDEIDVYNALIPGPRELSATLMIEIEEASRILASSTIRSTRHISWI